MSSAPTVTVVMPVRNGAAFIREAIDSILAQDFTDYELLILNDGSTDGTVAIVESYTDPRVRLLSYPHGPGMAYVRIEGMRVARGKFVALLDADDISLPSRLRKQVAFLDANPQVVLCGTLARTIGDPPHIEMILPTSPQAIACRLLLWNAFVHSAVMMRRQLLEKAGLNYRRDFERAQDYDLFARCAQHYPVANLPEVLTLYRRHPNQVSVVHRGAQATFCQRIVREQLQHFGLEPSAEELRTHLLISASNRPLSAEQIDDLEKWLKKLLAHNRARQQYAEPVFGEILGEQWIGVFLRGRSPGLWFWRRCLQSSLFQRSGFDATRFRRTEGRRWALDLVAQSYDEPQAAAVRARRLVEAACICPKIVVERFFLGACKQLAYSLCRN